MAKKFLAMLAVLVMSGNLAAQTVILEYDSSTGMLPEDFGWFHEGRSLERTCPGSIDETCRFYGNLDQDPFNGLADNDGTILPVGGFTTSRGGNLDNSFPISGTDNNSPAPLFGGYDVCYPPEPQGVSGAETYGEWIEFDGGEEHMQHVDTATGPRTPYGATQDLILPAGVCTLGECTAGKSGASCITDDDCTEAFPNAPDHEVLRLVGGDGNGIANSLPANQSSNRNEGKIKVRDNYPGTYTGGPITVVFNGAFGVKGTPDNTRVIFEYDVVTADGLNHTAFEFSHLWDNGNFTCNDELDPSEAGACGKFVANNGGPIEIMDDVYTDVYRFVELRIACDADIARGGNPDQACTIWVTDIENGTRISSTLPPAYVPDNKTGSGNDFRWGLISTADITMWVDSLQVLDGWVEPPPIGCSFAADPVFDIRNDVGDPGTNGAVDELDFLAFVNECATGPAAPVGELDTKPAECKCMDLNEDGSLDQTDFARFQRCLGLSGAALEACDD